MTADGPFAAAEPTAARMMTAVQLVVIRKVS
jgi:hypothetical protein